MPTISKAPAGRISRKYTGIAPQSTYAAIPNSSPARADPRSSDVTGRG